MEQEPDRDLSLTERESHLWTTSKQYMLGNIDVNELERAEHLYSLPLESGQNVFVTDHNFLKVQRYRWFRLADIILNVLLALIILFVLPFPSNVWTAALGAILSVFIFQLCIITIKKPRAMVFGMGVALWWGYAAFTIATAFSHLPVVSVFCFFFALAIGVGTHIWYVNNKLK
jgi:hypothetical protein